MKQELIIENPAVLSLGDAVSKKENKHLFTLVLLGSSLSILIGVLWDISWHMSIGRDAFFSPPHIAIYLGGVVAGLTSIAKTVVTSFFTSPIEKERYVSFWGLRTPFGAMFCIWGAGAMLTSAPFDDWWHNTYGLDVKILSPPHALLAFGIFGIQLGSMFSILAIQNSRAASTFWKYAYLVSAGVFLAIVYIFIIEYMGRAKMRNPLFYEVAGGVLPMFLLAGAFPVHVKYRHTIVAASYMTIFLLALWIFPLFPAEPKLSPVRNPVDHFVPLPFPLWLIVPAFLIDLVASKMITAGRWAKAVAFGVTFITTLFLVQYFFSAFLMSPSARNWVFGAHEWTYYADPNARYRYQFVPFKGSAFDYAWQMGFAFVLSVLSSFLGLKWGDWMARIKR